jgi:hypothetical protein
MSDALTLEFPAPSLIGAFKTFGAFGPAYEVIAPIQPLADGDWLVHIRMLETGEDAEYRYTRILDDPKAE